jgi:hypothetical protein
MIATLPGKTTISVLQTLGPLDPLLDRARVLSLCFQRLVNFGGGV